MFAVIETGGKQYRVEEGALVSIEKLDADVGSTVEFDRVLLIADGDEVNIGSPTVESAKVSGEVIEQGRHRKVRVIKFKRRKNYLRRAGHRQHFTAVKITGISQ